MLKNEDRLYIKSHRTRLSKSMACDKRGIDESTPSKQYQLLIFAFIHISRVMYIFLLSHMDRFDKIHMNSWNQIALI